MNQAQSEMEEAVADWLESCDQIPDSYNYQNGPD